MNKINVLTKKQQYLVVAFSVALSLLVVWLAVYGATTISTDISTGGTLSVTGASTLTGNVTASGLLTVAGNGTFSNSLSVENSFGASSTVYVTGSTTIVSALNVSGNTVLAGTIEMRDYISSSSTVKGAFNASGNTVLAGTLESRGNIGVASSTPRTELSLAGTGTTTMSAYSGTTGKGGCIELLTTGGQIIRIYATSTFGAGVPIPLYAELGGCK